MCPLLPHQNKSEAVAECLRNRTNILLNIVVSWRFKFLKAIQNCLPGTRKQSELIALPGTLKGTTSESSPSSWAFLARLCERRAYSSCSVRETEKAAARRSAEWPMVSLVENSATAGSWGKRHTGLEMLLRILHTPRLFGGVN